MDYEKYYDRKNHLYVIHFANTNGYSIDELKTMFSTYGEMTVDCRQQFGLCFIRYRNLEDTIKCLNGFKDHKSIRILKHKNKMGNSFIGKNATKKEQKFPEKNLGSSLNITESSNKVGNHKQFDQNSLVSKRDSDRDRSVSKRDSDHDRSVCSYSISSEISNQDEIPSLTYNNKIKIVQAEEVIIANIHPTLGLQDILNLFKDFPPICTTFIERVPHTEIRYCHAYFRTASDALAVEKKFDKFFLHENVLIVLRSQMLIEEALFK